MGKRRSSRRTRARALLKRAEKVSARELHHQNQQSTHSKARRTKHAGAASGQKSRFRADKPRRANGGSNQAVPDPSESVTDTSDDSNRDPLKGVRDVALGDVYATKALVQAALAGLAFRGSRRTGIVNPQTNGGLPMAGTATDTFQKASTYWSTPEAQDALSEMYSGPTGGFTP
jgi:hypothetical protein